MATAKQKLALKEYEFDINKYRQTTDYKSLQEARKFINHFYVELNDDIEELGDYIYSLSTKQSAFDEIESKAKIILKLSNSDDIYIKNTLDIEDMQFLNNIINGSFRYEIKLNELKAEFEKINVFYTEGKNNLNFLTKKDLDEKSEIERIQDVEAIFRSVVVSMDRNLRTHLEGLDQIIEYLFNFDFEYYQNRYPKFYKENR